MNSFTLERDIYTIVAQMLKPFLMFASRSACNIFNQTAVAKTVTAVQQQCNTYVQHIVASILAKK